MVVYQKSNSEAGMAMIIALVMVFISSIIASSYMSLVNSESKNSIWQKDRVQALFLAEAGVHKGLYYLNNAGSRPDSWLGENGQLLPTPLGISEDFDEVGSYTISLHDSNEASYGWLPSDSYLVESDGVIEHIDRDVERGVACIVSKSGGITVPAAVTIIDDADPEDEFLNFNSNSWTIDGRDIDGGPGVPGVLITNTADGLPGQFPGNRINRVTGEEENGFPTQGADAIVETDDPAFYMDLAAIVDALRGTWVDLSGSGTIADQTIFGAPDDFGVFYADLAQGGLYLSGQATGYGILILESYGELRISGRLDWNGIVLCSGDSYITLVGGGNKIHILGGLLVGNGSVDMRGTADIVYSSANVAKLNEALEGYRIRSWCEGWGNPL